MTEDELRESLWKAFVDLPLDADVDDTIDAALAVTAPVLANARKAALEEAAKVADDAYADAPSGSYDNGGTQNGWQMASQEIMRLIRALTSNPK